MTPLQYLYVAIIVVITILIIRTTNNFLRRTVKSYMFVQT